MSLSRRELLAGAAAGLLWTGCAPRTVRRQRSDAPTRRIVLLAGPKSHEYGAHEHPASCRLMADQLNRVAGLHAEVLLSWPADQRVFDGVAALLVYADGGSANPLNGHFEELSALTRRGMSLGLLHFALIVDGDGPRQQMLEAIGGYYEPDWSVNPEWTAEFHNLPVHAITRGVAPLTIQDEWYYHMRFRPEMKGVMPLLTTLPPRETLNRPDGPHSNNPHVRKAVLEEQRPQHLAWCVEQSDGGRGFGFTGLHWFWNWAHDDFRTFLLNAAGWLAGLTVPAGGVASRRPTLDELIELCGPPPAGWDRQRVLDRVESWRQPPSRSSSRSRT